MNFLETAAWYISKRALRSARCGGVLLVAMMRLILSCAGS
jgi:hypothetical protein